MDGRSFDELVRRLAKERSRRSVLKGLIGGAAVLAGGRTATTLAAGKVDVCHWEASSGTYQWLSISQNGWLSGHKSQHPEDFLRSNCCMAGECGTDTTCVTYSCNAGTCAQTPHPVDCAYSDWNDWGACSSTCGGGTQTRTRTIVTEGACGGIPCDEESLSEQRPCNTDPCVDECEPGYEPLVDGCRACSTGTYSADGLTCVPCGPGTFVDYQGADLCSVCPTGSYVDLTGAASCIACECAGDCDAITGECAGGGLVPDYGACSVDGDCQSGQCGCDAPPGFPFCFCREVTCLPDGASCLGRSGAVSCCTGDCSKSGGIATCISNICDPPCSPGQNCAFGTMCL